MVLSGDVPSDCNLASFRHARFFDFFNEIGQNRKAANLEPSFRSAPIAVVRLAIQEQCRAALANCNETVIPRMPRFTNIGGAPLPAWRATTAAQGFSSCRFGTAISSRRLPSGRPNAALTSDGAKLDQVSFAATPP